MLWLELFPSLKVGINCMTQFLAKSASLYPENGFSWTRPVHHKALMGRFTQHGEHFVKWGTEPGWTDMTQLTTWQHFSTIALSSHCSFLHKSNSQFVHNQHKLIRCSCAATRILYTRTRGGAYQPLRARATAYILQRHSTRSRPAWTSARTNQTGSCFNAISSSRIPK